MSKFKCGQHVWLFNSLSMKFEEDDVYGILYVPVPVDGVDQDSAKSVRERLEMGLMRVAEQYQLCGHQGILDAEMLFGSLEECRSFYRGFFGGD